MKHLLGSWKLERRVFVPTVICIAAACILDSIAPWGLVQAIDMGVESKSVATLVAWIGLVAILQIVGSLGRYWGRCRVAYLGLQLERRRTISLFRRCLYADIRSIPDFSQGKSMGQILFAAGSERRFIESILNQGIPLIVTSLGSFIALLTLSVPLAFLCFILCPFAGVLWLWMRRSIRPAARLEFEKREELFRRMGDVFRAITPIRALHQDGRFESQFETSAQGVSESALSLQKRIAVQTPYFDVLQALAMILVFGIGGFYAIEGDLSVGALIGFQVYLSRLFGLLRSGTGLFSAYQEYVEGCARAHAIESLPQWERMHFESSQTPELLCVSHLNFSFDTHNVWQDYSICVHEGEKKCILLPSGSGKTTLARCILGLYKTEKGVIAIPDGDTRSIGFVPQDAALFEGSLRDNIVLMNEDLSDSEYALLLHMCCLETLESRLGEMSIGFCGARLSGGEQRRVMLARALASRPKLLMIDQMTSEIEPELCREIFARIMDVYPKLGILYLGHRAPEW